VVNLAYMNDIIKSLIPLLPRYPEEGSDASRIGKQEIITALVGQFGVEQIQSVQTTLELVENLLTSLSLLDNGELQRGEWKFLSHPAQLLALSLLNTLADPRQKLFPSDFWHTGVGDAESQLQKQALEALENRRHAHHQDGTDASPPIRFVYVAWSIIKLGDKILCHQREASEHTKEYGLIGGRCNARDLKKVLGESVSTQALLDALQSPHSETMFQSLEHTLHRELSEEVKLLYGAGHYEAQVWRDLKPYTNCMGAAPNYALTQYFFRIYQIKLDITGYFAIRAQMRTCERLIECTLDEVAAGKTADNAKTLSIHAIYDDFGNDRVALKQALAALEPSYTNRYRFNDEKDSLIFSLEIDILRGNPGNEKPLGIDLMQEQKSLLLALAAHGKGLPLTLADSEAVTLHEFGWIEIHDGVLQAKLEQLSEHLRRASCPYIEITEPRYFRVSLPPELIFFDQVFFAYRFQKQDKYNGTFDLQRPKILTDIGTIEAGHCTIPLTNTLPDQLTKVLQGKLSVGDDVSLPKKVRESMQKHYQAMGLRCLLLRRDGRYVIAGKPL